MPLNTESASAVNSRQWLNRIENQATTACTYRDFGAWHNQAELILVLAVRLFESRDKFFSGDRPGSFSTCRVVSSIQIILMQMNTPLKQVIAACACLSAHDTELVRAATQIKAFIAWLWLSWIGHALYQNRLCHSRQALIVSSGRDWMFSKGRKDLWVWGCFSAWSLSW